MTACLHCTLQESPQLFQHDWTQLPHPTKSYMLDVWDRGEWRQEATTYNFCTDCKQWGWIALSAPCPEKVARHIELREEEAA